MNIVALKALISQNELLIKTDPIHSTVMQDLKHGNCSTRNLRRGREAGWRPVSVMFPEEKNMHHRTHPEGSTPERKASRDPRIVQLEKKIYSYMNPE